MGHPPLISLTTDFGTRDGYVGAMKGVILGICPEARIVDLTHEIPPRQILAGAQALMNALPHFPAGSIHLAVVDPGVGSERRALAMRVGNRFLVGPDNGIFWPLWKQAGDDPALLAVELSSRRYFHEPVSATFHGRDVFAPVAAHLAQGVELTDLGPEIEAPAALRLPTIQREPGVLLGQIVRVDHFGNCITNISRADLIGLGSIDKLQIKASGQGFGPLRNTYSQVEPGQALALIDSNGMLELAMRDGPLAKEFDLAVGSQVRARCS